VNGEMVNVYYDVGSEDGKSKLIPTPPRALYSGEIYELFVTDDKNAKPGRNVKRYEIIGHFEVKQAGLIREGDVVSVKGKKVGKVAGYEPCKVLRAPEQAIIHIFAKTDKKIHGSKELGIKLGDEVRFSPVDSKFT
jgi:Family of unknown function (DUF6917)